MIRLRDVTRAYGNPPVLALHGLSLEIAKNEFVAITGPSGCGKSTLMHLIGGLDRPTSGEIFVDSLALHKAAEKELTAYRRTRLGIVFQFFNLLPSMSLLENVSLPLLLQGVGLASAEARAMELVELVGLGGMERRLIHQLSGGELQRTAIARALVHKPAVVLADEPTGNLDSGNARQVIELFQKISSQSLATMILVTHSEEVAAAAGRRICMRDGHITDT